MRAIKTIFFSTVVAIIGSNIYALPSASPLYSQAFSIERKIGGDIEIVRPSVSCSSCRNLDWSWATTGSITYALPSAIEHGDFYVNFRLELNNGIPGGCGYQTRIPFTIETNGDFKMENGTFPITIFNSIGPKCDAYSPLPMTRVVSEGGNIKLIIE